MQKKIVEMFDSIAPKYDVANRILSLGIDKKWRKEAVQEAVGKIDKDDLKILDVACGTGDMIDIWKNTIKNKKLKICGLDPSKGMLEVAKKRFPEINFYNSYATEIPCEDNSVDAVSISFGIRNVLEIEKALREFNRILKENGKLLILEFVKSNKEKKFRKCIDFYTNKFLPKIGGIITKNKEAYEYLPKSIENFYTVNELRDLLKKAGFEVEKVKLFNFSQVAMIIAEKAGKPAN
ncbi:bifunctional demethylmenaquinone methyltransferase/2-methoxy-6-polyprenyl-1,4-benzoquinol methylase UbiE [Lebetimonas sp. JH292]|uniref:bifunctional demethylmenaquinone methyltransferase/2-methoxy-6-polyprenyl-1,4-benzoquinol methylase UbiE n=1 Tax=Lebetimonas sp. JH292 TaxID=990068 RepID=UPI0004648B16|nr:bifunctional demethylmenaquinone methyltransferase/2-methoxy-6-polyprenyl-1,4-benzoquinol methylase UbiE [Lebetimonas sp. JH292]